ncbi:MAG TPA: NAD(P)/FAD-dependent oxidoreductase [Ignavibacteriaceae bacterium]|nr:NAD(P)/FAD-dependent oxidoreductase [Ignavibacteriaceae bacterium]
MIEKFYDLIVVGAGPAGSISAKFAAEKSIKVLLLEKDSIVGFPVRCGEAISKRSLTQFINPDSSFIKTEINKFSLISPDNTEIILEFQETGYVLNRIFFDAELANQAVNAGAQLLTSAYVFDLIIEDGKVCGVKFEYNNDVVEVKSKIVIAADGVESRVGRWAGLKTAISHRDMESCIQYSTSNVNLNPNTCYFYFGKDVAPGGYLWAFPKGNNSANIGLGISGVEGKNKNANKYLDEFMTMKFPDAKIENVIVGGDPCSITLDKISAPGIMLTGDAARQVNPLSGGGLSSGMIGGSIAGSIAAEAILCNNPDKIFEYDKVWYERLGKKHEMYNRIKNGIYDFDDNKFNSIASVFLKVPPNKRTLGRLFTTALINKPNLLIDVAKVFF